MSGQVSEDCLPIFGATDPDNQGNEFKGVARRAHFSGVGYSNRRENLTQSGVQNTRALLALDCISVSKEPDFVPLFSAVHSPGLILVVAGWQPGASCPCPGSESTIVPVFYV